MKKGVTKLNATEGVACNDMKSNNEYNQHEVVVMKWARQ